MGLSPPEESEIDQEFKRLDTNNDGKLSKEEFKILVKDLAVFSVENMWIYRHHWALLRKMWLMQNINLKNLIKKIQYFIRSF